MFTGAYVWPGQSEMKRTSYGNAVSEVPDLWPIKKALTHSDVDITHPFLTLARQHVESHIVVYMTPQEQNHLRSEGQVGLDAQDDDTGEMYVMKLKWRGSYYNLIGKWGKIVRGKGLDVGQEIKLRWFNNCLFFSVSQQQQQQLVGPAPPIRVPAPVLAVRMLAAPPLVDHDHNWPIRKVLTLSDVDPTHPFLPLPRKSVEDHILSQWSLQDREILRKEDHVSVNARDYDTGEIYRMKLKWHGNYYNLVGKWGNIVRHKGLIVGQEFRLRWMNGVLHFSVSDGLYGQIGAAHDNWPIKKALTSSDVDTNHPFLTLPGKAVEDHILFYWGQMAREHLRNERQVGINARDGDTGEVYVMKLRWRGSYYNLIGKWGKIIREKMLNVGMEIRVRWDNGILIFSVPQ